MSDFFIGEIRNFSFNMVPAGWVHCDGSALPISQYAALYSLLGQAFGGTSTSFNLPDLRGRVMISQGVTAQGKIYNRGTAGGMEAVPLTAEQLPPHNHNLQCRSESGAVGVIAGNIVSTSGTNATITTPQPLYAVPATLVALNPGSLGVTGTATGHANMQPFEVSNFCISTTGIYPSRS